MSTPTATYRLQFREGMTFERAAALVPYLARLGVSHLYASPIFSATRGSTHGYDVTDHNELDPDLGGRPGFDRLSDALRRAGLGLILDIVPNHMAASLENPWWRSVVEWGEQSPYSGHFDIDWREPLTLPILGRPFPEAVAAGEIAFAVDAEHGCLALGYFDMRLPLHPPGYGTLLAHLDERLAQAVGAAVAGADAKPAAALRDRMRALLSDTGDAARLEEALARMSQDAALLEQVHAEQPWRLRFWKEARKHLSYRRFFEVTGLVGVRVEDARVFDDVHRLVLDLVRSGRVDGLRIDHVDGLADPKGYLEQLRREVGPDTYLVVEKILEGHEELPSDWPVGGTTGYEFIADLAGVLVDERGVEALATAYAGVAGRALDPEAERHVAKRLMACHNFEGELDALVRLGEAILAAAATAPAIGRERLKAALVAIVTAFPVYRTYGTEVGLSAEDRALLERVGADARGEGDAEAVGFVLGILKGDIASEAPQPALLFRSRFQQLTGPIMAKAVEDTLFYRYVPFIALNEVGGDPTRRGTSVEQFHAAMSRRARLQPHGLTGTATHDTKRGEDTRARLYALSEAPETWVRAVARWRGMNAAAVGDLPDGPAPEPEVEWMLYQALAGVWLDAALSERSARATLAARLAGFAEKAVREAKLRTSWTDGREPYEAAVKAFAARLLAPESEAFLRDFADVAEPFIRAGRLNGLAQTLVKLVAPGIPDIYQGTERWDLSLVDPDNRRPPDFGGLADMSGRDAGCSAEHLATGAFKQRLITVGLALRRARPALFAEGTYAPLAVLGARREHLIAFMRKDQDAVAIAVVPRLTLGLADESGRIDRERWQDTAVELPACLRGTHLAELLTGTHFAAADRLQVRELLGACPVALLTDAGIE